MTPDRFCFYLYGFMDVTTWRAPSPVEWTNIITMLKQVKNGSTHETLTSAFCCWLRGYIDITGSESPDDDRWPTICNKLKNIITATPKKNEAKGDTLDDYKKLIESERDPKIDRERKWPWNPNEQPTPWESEPIDPRKPRLFLKDRTDRCCEAPDAAHMKDYND